ncbi:MAG: sulfurtransferase-like selenium metabolism protein YedF [Geobacter sp.]|jgi:selenium metabolism protein YedF
MITIDCRGQACPAPVIATKRALEASPSGVRVLLDDGAPRENVTRFAQTRGLTVAETPDGTGWSLQITGKTGLTAAPPTTHAPTNGERVLLITSDRLGEGADELGRLLMRNFLHTLLETAERPDRILFLNSGVLLTVQGAETIEALSALEGLGVELFSCGVCLDFFKKKDQLAVGKTTNMFSTAEQLLAAASVIRL